MSKIIKEDYKFEKSALKKDEALKIFKKMDEPYKAELIEACLITRSLSIKTVILQTSARGRT